MMSNYTKENLVNLSNNSGEITNNFYTNDNDLIDHRKYPLLIMTQNYRLSLLKSSLRRQRK